MNLKGITISSLTKIDQGFSLLEILIVMLLVVILAVMGGAVFEKARDVALQARCANNMRNYGVGIMTYVADRGSLPWWDGGASQGADQTSTTPNFELWLRPYLHGSLNDRLRCPLGNASLNIKYPYCMNYSGNGALCEYYPRLNNIPAPSSRIILATEMYNYQLFSHEIHLNITMWGIDSVAALGDITSFQEKEGTYQPPQYHGSKEHPGLNVFFLDGHVELVSPVGGDWAKSPTMGNATNGGYFYSRNQFSKMKTGSLVVH